MSDPTARLVPVTPRDVVVIDRAIATLRAADMLGDAMTELVDLRERMVKASVRADAHATT